MKYFISFIFLFSQIYLSYSVSTDSFVIELSDRNIRVFSPKKVEQVVSVIIKNNGLSPLKGRLYSNDNTFSENISVYPNKMTSVQIPYNKTKSKFFFVPLAPAFQEVPLTHGKDVFQIPADN